jgi:NitT/TauT family transport system substrate-binding protein
MSSKYIITLTLLVFLAGSILSACAPANPRPGVGNEFVTLKVVVLPILDSLPMYVAQQEGLFAKHGIQVELIPVVSGPERDQLIAANQADGMVNEVLSTLFFNREGVRVQTVRYARAATSDVRLFSILASGKNDIDRVEELKGVEIGVSQGTIIEYLTDRLLQAEGFHPEDIRVVAVPKMDYRMSLLSSGELKAAMLPEPLTSLSEQQGARIVLDDTRHPEYSFSTLTFRKETLDKHPEAVRAFLKAVEEAVELINREPSHWSSLLVDLQLVPPPLAGSFDVPTFVTAGVPSEAQWDDTVEWAKTKGLLDRDVSYKDSVRSDLLP